MRKIVKHCDFYFFETLGIVFQKYSGRCFYHTLPNVSNIKKSQCLTETSNSSLSKKDLAIFRGKTMTIIINYIRSPTRKKNHAHANDHASVQPQSTRCFLFGQVFVSRLRSCTHEKFMLFLLPKSKFLDYEIFENFDF